MSDIETEGNPEYWLSSRKQVINPQRKAAKNVVAVEGKRGGREYRSLTAPLDFYVLKGWISERQYDAGEKFHAIWSKTSKSPYVQARYGDEGTGGKATYLPIGIFATEYREALAAIRGERERKVVFGVCCEELWASRVPAFNSLRTAERKAMQHLVNALDDLAAHFRV